MFISACYYHSRPRMDKSKDKLSYFFPRGREDGYQAPIPDPDSLRALFTVISRKLPRRSKKVKKAPHKNLSHTPSHFRPSQTVHTQTRSARTPPLAEGTLLQAGIPFRPPGRFQSPPNRSLPRQTALSRPASPAALHPEKGHTPGCLLS